jgi:hypothetical protein
MDECFLIQCIWKYAFFLYSYKSSLSFDAFDHSFKGIMPLVKMQELFFQTFSNG